MGAYSTLHITRSRAKQVVIQSILTDLSDNVLEEHLDRILESRLYNVRIVLDDQENDDPILTYGP